jgi:transglutaminase-like putative cysteine protease
MARPVEPPQAELRKWDYLRDAPLEDMRDPRMQRLASLLWAAAGERPRVYCILCQALCRDAIRYQTDTARVGGEDFGSPADAIERGVDDCDAKARAFVTLCLLKNQRAEMVPLWKGGQLKHVYARVLLDGQWLPVELTLARARLGEEPLRVPKEPDTGQWLRT